MNLTRRIFVFSPLEVALYFLLSRVPGQGTSMETPNGVSYLCEEFYQ